MFFATIVIAYCSRDITTSTVHLIIHGP